jgi:hypothetical protein
LASGTDGIDDVVDVVVQGWLGYGGSVGLVSKQTNRKVDTMNTMINPSNEPREASREELIEEIKDGLKRIAELEQQLDGKATVLAMANESLQSYKRQITDTKANVEALAHEHLDDEGGMFYDAIVELFDIELTRVVTFQYSVSVEVQATVPAGYDTDELIYELTNAKLDYEFHGDAQIIIEDFSFGSMEVE